MNSTNHTMSKQSLKTQEYINVHLLKDYDSKISIKCHNGLVGLVVNGVSAFLGHHPTKTWGRYVSGLPSGRSRCSQYCNETGFVSLQHSLQRDEATHFTSLMQNGSITIRRSQILHYLILILFLLMGNKGIAGAKFHGATTSFSKCESYSFLPSSSYAIIYVDASNTSGIETGNSWATAFTSLQDAIDSYNSNSESMSQIWVAMGNYRPDIGINYTLNDRNASFILPSNVQMLGGFPSGGGSISERDWTSYPTRLNGEIGSAGNQDNSANIIITQNVSDNTILDGFIIENGNANVITATGQIGGAWLNIVDGSTNRSAPLIRNCIFQNNSSITSGGAIYNNAVNGGVAEMSFTNCRFLYNETTSAFNGFGGAIYNGCTTNGVANMEIVNCYFEGNVGNIGGTIRSISRDGGTGAISLTVVNSIFYNNTAWSMPGISCFNLNFTSNINRIINSTFYGNISTEGVSGGGAIRMDNVSAGSLVNNCILWANVANESPSTNQLRIQGGSVSTRNNLIQDFTSTLNGNSNSNPQFVNASNGDFRLLETSPAIDSGDNDVYQSVTGVSPEDDIDLAGNSRLIGASIDRGPFEYDIPCPVGNVIYVDSAATGLNNGSSWTDAYTDLQNALDTECPGITEIWVAAGTYFPSENVTKTSTGPMDRNNTFLLRDDLAIYGGFLGGEYSRSERDWRTNITTLSGDINRSGTHDGNSIAVVTGLNINNSAVIDGFFITKGNADINEVFAPPPGNTDRTGGGMYIFNGSPIVKNCTFTDNKALFGGAMYTTGSSPTIHNCIFQGNTAFIGGGIQITSSSSPEFLNCIFIGNVSDNDGGAMYITASSTPTIINSTLSGNAAGGQGGGLYINNNADVSISNSIIWNNSATPSNITTSLPASILTQFNASTIIRSSIIANSGGSENWQFNTFTADGGNNKDINPLFVEQPVIGIGAMGDLRLQACSPAIDAGNNQVNATATDLDGNPRLQNDVIDMGAYEFQSIPTPVIAICQPQTINLDDMGQTTLTANELDNGSSGCGVLVFSIEDQASISYNCNDLGSNYITLTVTDERNTISTCTATVSVVDNTPPVITCPPSLTFNCGESNDPPILILLDEDFSDNSAGWTLDPEWEIGPAMGGCGDPDTDHSPSSDNGIAGVVIGGCASIRLHDYYFLTSPVIDASGAGDDLTLSYWRHLWSDIFPFMDNIVQVFDGSVWQTIWESFEAPEIDDRAWTFHSFGISAYKNSMLRVRFGFKDGSPSTIDVGSWNLDDILITTSMSAIATDNCDDNNLMISYTDAPSNETCPGCTIINRIWTATDNSNNSSQCVQEITILDVPQLTGTLAIVNSTCTDCTLSGGSIAIGSLSGTGGTLEFSTDNGMTWSNTLPTYNQSGPAQTILASVLSAFGCRGESMIVGTTMPGSCVAPDDPNIESNNGLVLSCIIPSTTLSVSALGSYTWLQDNNPFGDGSSILVTTEGLYTLIVTETNGCTASSSVMVTFTPDNTPPVALCQDVTVSLDAMGNGSTTAEVVNNGSNDECGIKSLALSQTEFNCMDIPSIMVIVTVTDSNDNTATCTATLTVVDNIFPTLQCFNQTITFNGEQNINLDADDLMDASDNCAIQSVVLSPPSISSEQVGQTVPVNVSVTDVGGNTSGCISQITVTGLPTGWSQNPNGIGCNNGNNIGYNAATNIWTATSTNCFSGNPFNSDAMAFAQQTLCGNGSITAQVTGISGTALGWAGVSMRENNSGGAKKAQLLTNLSNFSRREFRTVTGGSAIPQQFLSTNRYWLRLVRSGNQFSMHVSADGVTWFFAGAQNIVMPSCIETGLVLTNYTSNSTVSATFSNVTVVGSGQSLVTGDPVSMDQHNLRTSEVTIYPNPAQSEAWIEIGDYSGEEVSIQIRDINGRIIYHQGKHQQGASRQRLDLSGMTSGVYMVEIDRAGYKKTVERLVVIGLR